MSSPTVEELYEYYEVVNGASESDEQKRAAYQSILRGVLGDDRAKRLASQFIAHFFRRFPDLMDEAFNRLLDLCEDDCGSIRRLAARYLVAVGRGEPRLYVARVADTLTQMLGASEDAGEAGAVGAALVSVLRIDSTTTGPSGAEGAAAAHSAGKDALEAVLVQIEAQLAAGGQGDSLGCAAAQVLKLLSAEADTLCEEAQAVLEAHSGRLMELLAGKDEFPVLVAALAPLRAFSGLAARQRLVAALTAEALGPRSASTLLALARQAARLLSKNVHGQDLLWACVSRAIAMLDQDDQASAAEELQQLVRVIAELAASAASVTSVAIAPASKTTADAADPAVTAGTTPATAATDAAALAQQLVERLVRRVSESLSLRAGTGTDTDTDGAAVAQGDGQAVAISGGGGSEDELAAMSKDAALLARLEDWLLAAHNVCKVRPQALCALPDEDRALFRQRLQLAGRLAQLAASAATRSKDAADSEQQAARNAANVQLLVREFFKPAASQWRATIAPSWVPLAPATVATGDGDGARNRRRKAPPAGAGTSGRGGSGKTARLSFPGNNAGNNGAHFHNASRRGRRR